MYFINFAEIAGLVDSGFDKTEVVSSTTNGVKTTTVYGGKANVTDPTDADIRTDWNIRRAVIVEDGDTTRITTGWAVGSWNNRESLTYNYR